MQICLKYILIDNNELLRELVDSSWNPIELRNRFKSLRKRLVGQNSCQNPFQKPLYYRRARKLSEIWRRFFRLDQVGFQGPKTCRIPLAPASRHYFLINLVGMCSSASENTSNGFALQTSLYIMQWPARRAHFISRCCYPSITIFFAQY